MERLGAECLAPGNVVGGERILALARAHAQGRAVVQELFRFVALYWVLRRSGLLPAGVSRGQLRAAVTRLPGAGDIFSIFRLNGCELLDGPGGSDPLGDERYARVFGPFDADCDGPPERLGAAWEAILGLVPRFEGPFVLVEPETGDGARRRSGSYYTPPALVEHILDETGVSSLPEGIRLRAGAFTVLDPACGTGNFLLAALRRLGADGASGLYGMDTDTVAIAVCRAVLWLALGDPTVPVDRFEARVQWADGLLDDPPFSDIGEGFDAVVGNPPYLNQLGADTTVDRETAARLQARFGAARRAYTDVATLFVLRAVDLARPRGRVALVTPLSLLAAKDAEPARKRLTERARFWSVWLTTDRIFPDADVRVCVVALEVFRGTQMGIRRAFGNDFEPAAPLLAGHEAIADAPTWGHLVADLLGVPAVHLPLPAGPHRVLGDIARTTADFRDQYYGLAGCIVEHVDGMDEREFPRLVVTGMIDVGRSLWGVRGGTYAGVRYERPRVDLARLSPSMRAWAATRLVPKIVLATQTRVLEAFADPDGIVLNAVPTITVIPNDPADLWRVLAVLLAPPVSAWALARYAGVALSTDAIKLSARQVAEIPLPAPSLNWVGGGFHAKAAASSPEPARLLLAMGTRMCMAYRAPTDATFEWWKARLPTVRAPTPAPDAPAAPGRPSRG